jgi:benzoyl-CoA reductase/2-hydroxyglutaryl-CoA dehydratase subunit BcrC/BadD/HgdB
MAFSLANLVAFYPDGAWWTPCVMEMSDGLLAVADSLGLDESFCPVRAMLAAFVTRDRFPIPDLLTCRAGATCDDFAAVAQRIEDLGHPILWWELPPRRIPETGEPIAILPGGLAAPAAQVAWVRHELERMRTALEALAGEELTDQKLADGIRAANAIRRRLAELRQAVFTAPRAPLPALELHLAEMLAIHFCSDRTETAAVLDDLLAEVRSRVAADAGI